MKRSDVLALLEQVRKQQCDVETAAERLATLPFEDCGFAKVDHHRSLRSGLPEVIFGQGKTAEQVAEILDRLKASGVPSLATRCSPEMFDEVRKIVPEAQYHASARCITHGHPEEEKLVGNAVVVCAGTSDLPVADEAALTARMFGVRVTQITDVGVAGLHRLLAQLPILRSADVLVVCAGMEGALPSVVGGLVRSPVIAVPTSVGYGASLGGVTALLGMLNSCSPNISVVNIDNGFGAGYLAALYASRDHNMAERSLMPD